VYQAEKTKRRGWAEEPQPKKGGEEIRTANAPLDASGASIEEIRASTNIKEKAKKQLQTRGEKGGWEISIGEPRGW